MQTPLPRSRGTVSPHCDDRHATNEQRRPGCASSPAGVVNCWCVLGVFLRRGLRALRRREFLGARDVRLRLAELAVQLVLIALALDRPDLLAVGAGHVEVAGVVLLIADRLDALAPRPRRVDRDDEFIFGGHTSISTA